MPRPSDPPEQPHHRPAVEDGVRDAPPFATVRLAVGLAHSIPGAELTFRRVDGGEVVAANRPGADVDLCSLRRLVMRSVGSSTADRWLEIVRVGGSVTPTSDGLWASEGPEPRRWFATMLRQERVIDVLGAIETEGIGDDEIEVLLKPDPCLGLTAVGVTARGPHLVDHLDELARRAHAACIVDELICSARIVAPDSQRSDGQVTPVDLDDITRGERP